MEKIAYYPGCTMKTTGAPAERTAHTVAAALGFELDEIERWNCCGTVFQLADDAIMQHIGAVRNLVRARDAGHQRLVTLCAICFNTLRRVEALYGTDADKRERIKVFMDEEKPYEGGVRTEHFLELFSNATALEKLKSAIVKPLTGLKPVAYYGCLLLRPEEFAISDKENPDLLEKVLLSAGAEPILSPLRTECCGSFKTTDDPSFVAERVYRIVSDARRAGANIVVTACPLCQFNLDARQRDVLSTYSAFVPMPIIYFTQLLHIALGGDPSSAGFEEHYISPKSLFETLGLI